MASRYLAATRGIGGHPIFSDVHPCCRCSSGSGARRPDRGVSLVLGEDTRDRTWSVAPAHLSSGNVRVASASHPYHLDMPSPRNVDRFEPRTRVAGFLARHPTGCIRTRIVRWTRRHVVVQARVYRVVDDGRPAATAFGVWYREPAAGRHAIADGQLEAVESLAVERALALLDLSPDAPAARPRAAVALAPTPAAVPTLAPAVCDLLALLDRAARGAVRPRRAARWRERLLDARTRPAPVRLAVLEERLRRRLARQAGG